MKIPVKVKATGDIVDVTISVAIAGNPLYTTSGGITYLGDDIEPAEPDWQQVHIQAAIAAMQGMLANPAHQEAQAESGEPFGYFYAMNAIMCADVLVTELQKKGGQDDS